MTIAIDGPAASGKSTVGQALAERLGYLYFDTGVMYRAVTWAALERDVEVDDEEAVTALAEELDIHVTGATKDGGRQYTVLADAVDVTWSIRTPEVDANVSVVSAYPGVRRALVAKQRRIAVDRPVVMVGRDIGTVVLPEADLKIYLDASVEERALRRWREMEERGKRADYRAVLRSMRRRDRIDSNRDASPLRPAEDSFRIDTTDLNVAQVVAATVGLVHEQDCP
ncbi:MAG: (d)CMP kinase [Anaerolineae bacterium]|jgi:cytidylate kinase